MIFYILVAKSVKVNFHSVTRYLLVSFLRFLAFVSRNWQLFTVRVDCFRHEMIPYFKNSEDCIYSVLHPKSTALFKKQLLDLECCKHKCLVEICFYSDADPNLHLDQKQNYFWLQLPKFDPNPAI